MSTVRTRFAPSPTGNLHIGNLRTAVYAYALAKHNHGEFLLRIEDTDQARSNKESEEEIYKYLELFGLKYDEKHIQSERMKMGVYKSAADRLVKEGHAYLDEGAIRLKVPKDEQVSYHDFVLDKDVEWNTNDVKDLVILKSDGFPTYHLAVVVDDHDMGITHVLRGHDWIPSTPLHLLIYKYLGYQLPQIGHLTDIMDPTGGKISKRKGSVSIKEFLAAGYLPEALLNYMILVGWAPKDNRELFTLEEFVENFDPGGFQKSNPVFNTAKLDWFNGHYIRQKSENELLKLLKFFIKYEVSDEQLLRIIPLVKERMTKLSEFNQLAGFFFERPHMDEYIVSNIPPNVVGTVSSSGATINNLDINTLRNPVELNNYFIRDIKEHGYKTGDYFMGLRYGIAGSNVTPPITESISEIVNDKGKDEIVTRMNELKKILNKK
jgi:nondiscriminating glutamyl-tRNA synthetase